MLKQARLFKIVFIFKLSNQSLSVLFILATKMAEIFLVWGWVGFFSCILGWVFCLFVLFEVYSVSAFWNTGTPNTRPGGIFHRLK